MPSLKGKRVVVKLEVFKDQKKHEPEAMRVFICESGFGCNPFNMGSKIFGYYEHDQSGDTIRREWIEKVLGGA